MKDFKRDRWKQCGGMACLSALKVKGGFELGARRMVTLPPPPPPHRGFMLAILLLPPAPIAG